YACLAWRADKDCSDAVASAPARLDPNDTLVIETFFRTHTTDDTSCELNRYQAGSLRSALWLSKKHGAIQHGFQILPTFSLGIPIRLNQENDVTRALGAGHLSSRVGFVARYSPFG